MFSFLLRISRTGTAGSHGNPLFNHLRNCYTVFQNIWSFLNSHQAHMMVLTYPHPCQHLLDFLFWATLLTVAWYLIALLIYLFPFWRRSALGFLWREWCWSWNCSTLATSCEGLTHWKRPWCWEGLGAGGEGDDRGWDGWMASLTRWTWVSVNSGSWWWTGRPDVLRFMGLQRVGHDWATDLIWSDLISAKNKLGHNKFWTINVLVVHQGE